MADIIPFVATRYGSQLASEIANLVTPPYDVIDPKLQQALYERDPNNFVRVDFGKDLPGDNEYENRYSRAGALWQQWKSDGVIAEEPRKAFYVYEQEFALPDGRTIRRRGFYAAVRLQDFSEGGIRAHEQTFDGPKADRFRLMRATNGNLSPIFCLFDDPARTVDELLAQATDKKAVEFEFDGVTHRLWILAKASTIQEITRAMAPQILFIADGHHRYETSLLYRDEMRSALRQCNGRQPFDYTMIYMNNIHDEGLVILPTHRVLSKESSLGVNPAEVLDDLREAFEITPVELDVNDPEGEARRAIAMLEAAGRRSPSFFLLLPKCRAWLLAMKPGTNPGELIDDEGIPGEIKELDVSILHRYIIERVWMGNPEIELDDQDVHYIKDAAEVLRRMATGKYGVGFLVNPTRIGQVCAVAGKGLRMPHKSTYFFPKLVTGLVMRDFNSPW
ncbi:MAG: DUF1015 domain-containing protein [bacterium]|nr:DUF1015 domain-containing protein [bacterium]